MEKKEIWLSIIVPVYNGEKYLGECLRSISSQTFDDFEVIIVDDGSIDSTARICKEYYLNDSRFHYYKTENKGALHARIYGAKYAKGQFFTFCDSDDYYCKNAFKLLYDKVSCFPEKISLIQFGYKKKYNHLKQTVRYVSKACYVSSDKFYYRDYPKLLCSFWEKSRLNTSTWNKLYSCDLLPKLPIANERVFWGDDQILNIHLLQSIDGALYLPDMPYVYRQFSGDTGRFSIHTMEDLDIIKKYQLEFLGKRTADDIKVIENVLYSEMAGWFLIYVKEALNNLDENMVEELVRRTLLLPRFIMAQQYYQKNPKNWEGARLLALADAKEYIKSAKVQHSLSLKTKIINTMKYIYKHI